MSTSSQSSPAAATNTKGSTKSQRVLACESWNKSTDLFTGIHIRFYTDLLFPPCSSVCLLGRLRSSDGDASPSASCWTDFAATKVSCVRTVSNLSLYTQLAMQSDRIPLLKVCTSIVSLMTSLSMTDHTSSNGSTSFAL